MVKQPGFKLVNKWIRIEEMKRLYKFSVIAAFSISLSVIGSLCFVIKKIICYADTKLRNADRYREYFLLLNHWLMLKQNNICISEYFIKKGYSSIAVYGMSLIGIRLCDELKNTEVHIERTIDRAANTIYHPLGVYSPDQGLADLKADALILTVDADFETIRSYMKNKDIPLVKLTDIIFKI